MKIVFFNKETGEEIKDRDLAVDRDGEVLEIDDMPYGCIISYPAGISYEIREDDQ